MEYVSISLLFHHYSLPVYFLSLSSSLIHVPKPKKTFIVERREYMQWVCHQTTGPRSCAWWIDFYATHSCAVELWMVVGRRLVARTVTVLPEYSWMWATKYQQASWLRPFKRS